MDKCYQCDRKQYKDLFNDYYSIFGVLWRFDGRCRVDYSVQTEQKDERQVDIESMFVDAMKKGHGIAWELDLPRPTYQSFWRKTNGKSLFTAR